MLCLQALHEGAIFRLITTAQEHTCARSPTPFHTAGLWLRTISCQRCTRQVVVELNAAVSLAFLRFFNARIGLS